MSQLDPSKHYSKEDFKELANSSVDAESLSDSLETLRALPTNVRKNVTLLADNYAVLTENKDKWPKQNETKEWLCTLSVQARQTSNKNSFASMTAGPGNEDDTGCDLIVWLGEGPSYGGKEEEREEVSKWIINALGLEKESTVNQRTYLSGTLTQPMHSLSMLSMFPDAMSKGMSAIDQLNPKPLLEFRLGSSGKVPCIAGGIREGKEKGWVVLIGVGVFT